MRIAFELQSAIAISFVVAHILFEKPSEWDTKYNITTAAVKKNSEISAKTQFYFPMCYLIANK